MDRMIFVNLPVEDVAVSRRFYAGLGFPVDEVCSDDEVACVVVSPTILVMVLDRARFATFVSTEVADPRRTTQVLNGLSAASRDEVDELVARAVAHGGTALTAVEDGPMYGRSFSDPDGHVWEAIHTEVPEPF